jgi:hypothetical protein
MVTFQTVDKIAFAEPFKPFRIRMKDGRTLDVFDNESLFTGVSRLTIFPPLDPDSTAAMDHYPFDAIESLTLLETSTA